MTAPLADGPRCMGCAGTHQKCETQVAAERFIHRLFEAALASGVLFDPGVEDEYLENWL